MAQLKYIEEFKTIKSLRIENGWGISGRYFYSPKLIESWIKDGLIDEKGELTRTGARYFEKT